jgi:hypothetical protein
MRVGLRVLGWLVLLGLLLIAFAITYSTATGHMTWCFRVKGTVRVNSQETNGYLHANTKRTFLFVTRTDMGSPETYLVPLQGSDWVVDCGKWHPIRFFPIAISDVNPPCSGYDIPMGVRDAPTSPALIARRSVEFTAASGKKIKAEW